MKLKSKIIQQIKSDPILYGRIAKEIGVAPASLPRVLYGNDPRLTQAGVLQIIEEETGLSSKQIIEPKKVKS